MTFNSKFFFSFPFCLALTAAMSAFSATLFLKSHPKAGAYYQHLFAPAVLAACDRGYRNVKIESIPDLENFLRQKTKSFSCSTLPTEIKPIKLTSFQAGHQYLYYAVAYTWKVFGISWESVPVLLLALYVLTAIAAFLLIASFSPPLLASAGSIAYIASPEIFAQFPHLRDFAKAPFMLLCLWPVAKLINQDLNSRRWIGWSLLAGAFLGFGTGFRMDLLVLLPVLPVVILFFTKSKPLHNLGPKTISIAGFLVAFISFSLPIFSATQGGSDNFHAINLGLMKTFTLDLGVKDSPIYCWGHLYHDGFMNYVTNAFQALAFGPTKYIDLSTPEGEPINLKYLLEIVRHFPADILTRTYGAILGVLQYGLFGKWNLLVCLAAIGLVSWRDLKVGTLLILATVYFAGYPVMQFHTRHYFFLIILQFGFLIYLVSEAYHPTKRMIFERTRPVPRRHHSFVDLLPRARVLCIWAVSVATFFLIPLWALRLGQQSHLESYFQKYESAPSTPISLRKVSDNPDGTSDYLIEGVKLQSANEKVSMAFLKLEAGGAGCPTELFSTRYWYETSTTFIDMNYTSDWVVSPNAVNTLYFPVYAGPGHTFKGLKIQSREVNCLGKISQVGSLEDLKLLLWLDLPPNWRDKRLYQTL